MDRIRIETSVARFAGFVLLLIAYPALKRWAIIDCPLR
jgi:hypothetical protein